MKDTKLTFGTPMQYLQTVLPACFAQLLCKPDSPSLLSQSPCGVSHRGSSHPMSALLFGSGGHLFLPAINCSVTRTQLGLRSAGKAVTTCRQLQHCTLKPESKRRWQQARHNGENQAAILTVIPVIHRSHFSQFTG